jgi:hypothetical protein
MGSGLLLCLRIVAHFSSSPQKSLVRQDHLLGMRVNTQQRGAPECAAVCLISAK